MFLCVGNLRITSVFARKIASMRSLRIILSNFGIWMNRRFSNLCDQNFKGLWLSKGRY